MKFFQIWLQVAALLCGANALIVPDQLVSLLTLLYSTIPPVEKGTDSRIGVGFRFGPFADLQVLLELGPQKTTQPIGLSGNSISPSKRDTAPLDPLELQHLERTQRDREARGRALYDNSNAIPSSDSERSKAWLSRWRSSLDPGAPVLPIAIAQDSAVQKTQPVEITARSQGYQGYSNAGVSSRRAYQPALAQPPPVWNYPNIQRLRQLYTMAAKGG